jgi:hypothetical protein
MALHNAYIYPAKSPLTPVTPSATVGNHTTDGTDITITATAHGLIVGELVTLKGWGWATGAGVIDGTYYVKTVASANTFAVTPTTCPTNGSNPETVGTYELGSQRQYGCRLSVVASSGVRIGLPSGLWVIYNTGKSTDGSANAQQVAYRFASSSTDVTLPSTAFTVTSKLMQESININPADSAEVEVRDSKNILLESASGTVVVFIYPKTRGLMG